MRDCALCDGWMVGGDGEEGGGGAFASAWDDGVDVRPPGEDPKCTRIPSSAPRVGAKQKRERVDRTEPNRHTGRNDEFPYRQIAPGHGVCGVVVMMGRYTNERANG